MDLRRTSLRADRELIASRAAWLPPDQRVPILAVYADGRRADEVAKRLAVPPRSLRRKLHKIVNRLTSPDFSYVALHQHLWTPSMRKVAVACVLHGQTVREAAHALNLSYHAVRKQRETVLALAREWAVSRPSNALPPSPPDIPIPPAHTAPRTANAACTPRTTPHPRTARASPSSTPPWR